MSDESSIINPINLDAPVTAILKRLGHHRHKTKVPERRMNEIMALINQGAAACEPRGAWLELAVTGNDGFKVEFMDKAVIESGSLAKLLKNSGRAVFMATSVGPRIVALAAAACERGDAGSAAIFDAVGGEMADQAMDWMVDYLKTVFSRRGLRPGKTRFSPGYGDLTINNQALFFRLLGLGRIGLSLTPAMMLKPEKSVTAIVGLEPAYNPAD